MLLKGIGNWVKAKLDAIKHKGKEPGAKPQEASAKPQEASAKPGEKWPGRQQMRPRGFSPWWVRNNIHPTAGMEMRGRTLDPRAVATAAVWRSKRIKELISKAVQGIITAKERRELRRIQS